MPGRQSLGAQWNASHPSPAPRSLRPVVHFELSLSGELEPELLVELAEALRRLDASVQQR